MTTKRDPADISRADHEHGSFKTAEHVINLILKSAAKWNNDGVPLYVATYSYNDHGAPVWTVSPLRMALAQSVPEEGWIGDDVYGGEGIVLIGDRHDNQEIVFQQTSTQKEGH